MGSTTERLTAEQRSAIQARDRYRCQMDCRLTEACGGPRGRREVHHIEGYSESVQGGRNPNLPENLVTLCALFHRDGHEYGFPAAVIALLSRRARENTRRVISGENGHAQPRLREKFAELFPPKRSRGKSK